MLLNEQEVIKLWDSHTVPVFGKSGINPIVFAQLVESAVLEKLKAQEPVMYIHESGLLTGEDKDYNAGVRTGLYRHPLPPDDVVRDAERYRWLVDNSYDRDGFLQFQVWKHSWEPHSQTGIPIEWKCRVRGPAIDAAIDAAMKGGAA